MKDAFEGEESRGDLDCIQNLIMWIYQTEDVEKLEQMLNLAMSAATGAKELVAPTQTKKEGTGNAVDTSVAGESEKRDETTADVSHSVATPLNPSNQANNF